MSALARISDQTDDGPHLVIARCTRNGVTSWQHVAAQLGRSLDSVRSQFDASYRRSDGVQVLRMEPAVDAGDAADPTDVSSPYIRGPGLRIEILRVLRVHGSLPVESIAGRLSKTVVSVRVRLNDMRGDGLVRNDAAPNKQCRTWFITDKGRRAAVTGYETRDRARS